MYDLKKIIKKRGGFLIITVIACTILIINYLNMCLLPLFAEYGQHQCSNIITRVLNIVVNEQVEANLKEKNVIKDQNSETIEFNVELLNSLACNIVNKGQQILYNLQKGKLDDRYLNIIDENLNYKYLDEGIMYEVPISMVLRNSLLGWLGVKIPVKYGVIGEIRGEIISDITEYGINNAMLKIDLKVYTKAKILIPMNTQVEEIIVNFPLVVKVIQGEIPDYYLGSKVIGGVE